MKKEIFKQIDKLGRIVIPAEVRKIYGFKPGDKVFFSTQDNGILIHSKNYYYVRENDEENR